MFIRRIYELPILASFLYLAWVVPQAIAMERNGTALIYEGDALWLYATLCLLAMTAGFYAAGQRKLPAGKTIKIPVYDQGKLTTAVVGLVLFGAFCLFMISRLTITKLDGGWTGIATVYALGSQTLYYGLALAVIMCLRKPSPLLIAIIFGSLLMIAPYILTGVRRSAIFEVGVIFACSLLFIRSFRPPRIMVIVAFLVGTAFIHQVGAVRAYTQSGQGTLIDAMAEGVPFERFEYFNNTNSKEINQALFDVYVTRKTFSFEYGAEYYNVIIKQYVPAFILGREFKESLTLTTLQAADELGMEAFNSHGATRTGFSDTFRNFWYFGSVCFFAIGYVMGYFYRKASEGYILYQCLYIVLLNDALFAITESTARYVRILPFLGIVFVAVYLWSKWQTVPIKNYQGLKFLHLPQGKIA